jgi:P4 family phage/plasmid primase-like protien
MGGSRLSSSDSDEQQQFNDGANFWHYDVGVPTIPGQFKTKRPCVFWEGYQEHPPSEEEHKEWLKQGKYSGGVMILCGQVCYRKEIQNLYLVGVDIDKQKGIDEFCTRNGKTISLQDFAAHTLVEQHDDSPDRCHIFFLIPFKIPVKGPDDILGIEIKSSWDHGLMRVTPSVTEKGHPLKIIGTAKEPVRLNELQATELLQHINHICIDNGVDYLQKGNDSTGSKFLSPELRQVIKSLDVSFANKDKVKIQSGYRNVTLISVANSILFRHLNKDRDNEEHLKEFFFAINSFLCNPPLPNKEVETIWASAVRWAWPKILNEILHGKRKGVKAENDKQEKKQKKKEEQERIENLLDKLINEYHFKTVSTDDDIFYWDRARGIYLDGGAMIIQKRLEDDYLARLAAFEPAFSNEDNEDENKTVVDVLTNSDVKEFIGHIKRRTFFKRSEFDPDVEWLAFKNCMLNLLTGEVQAFSPDFLATIQVPVHYSEKAACPHIMKFLNEVVAPDDVEIILDVIAYCLWRAFPFQHWILFNARGGNGKGTLLSLIRKFLGGENVSAVSLQTLANDTNKFATSHFYGKLANIDADMSSEALKSTSMIKKLTGGDPIYAEYKFKPGFYFVNYAKPLFSANDIPVTPDQTDAFYRRPIIINFLNQFLAEDIDYNLLAKLTTDEELSGLLNVVLKRLPRILKEGLVQVTAEHIAKNYEKYTIGSDQAKAFIEICTESKSESVIPKIDLHEAYRRFCKHFKRNTETLQAFNRNVKEHGLHDRQEDNLPGRPRCWVGIKLIHFAPTQDESQTTFS